jgi:hypothetical protein
MSKAVMAVRIKRGNFAEAKEAPSCKIVLFHCGT